VGIPRVAMHHARIDIGGVEIQAALECAEYGLKLFGTKSASVAELFSSLCGAYAASVSTGPHLRYPPPKILDTLNATFNSRVIANQAQRLVKRYVRLIVC
jgi:hypothetical protein